MIQNWTFMWEAVNRHTSVCPCPLSLYIPWWRRTNTLTLLTLSPNPICLCVANASIKKLATVFELESFRRMNKATAVSGHSWMMSFIDSVYLLLSQTNIICLFDIFIGNIGWLWLINRLTRVHYRPILMRLINKICGTFTIQIRLQFYVEKSVSLEICVQFQRVQRKQNQDQKPILSISFEMCLLGWQI